MVMIKSHTHQNKEDLRLPRGNILWDFLKKPANYANPKRSKAETLGITIKQHLITCTIHIPLRKHLAHRLLLALPAAIILPHNLEEFLHKSNLYTCIIPPVVSIHAYYSAFEISGSKISSSTPLKWR